MTFQKYVVFVVRPDTWVLNWLAVALIGGVVALSLLLEWQDMNTTPESKRHVMVSIVILERFDPLPAMKPIKMIPAPKLPRPAKNSPDGAAAVTSAFVQPVVMA